MLTLKASSIILILQWKGGNYIIEYSLRDVVIQEIKGARIKDLTGKQFGKLKVLGYAGLDKHFKSTWWCQCSCENKTIKIIVGTELSKRNTQSCGCLIIEKNKARQIDNGLRSPDNRVYRIYRGMKDRCYNENGKDYSHYGGRGITICEEWLNDFSEFYKWAAHAGYKDNLTIDRIEVDKNYSPDNCRWTTTAVQNKNKTTSIKVIYNNQEWILKDLVDMLGLTDSYDTIKQRIVIHNWDVEKAIHKPIEIKNQKQIFIKTIINEFYNYKHNISMKEFCNKYNIKKYSIYTWLKQNDIIDLLKNNNIKYLEGGIFTNE